MRRSVLAALLPLACSLLILPSRPAAAQTDPMRFVAHAGDLADYFPTYLANGYFSTASTRHGTRAATAYLAAFMDQTPGDVARPAAVPGWSGIDYFDGHAWLNNAPIGSVQFSGYRQVLDMRDATLVTHYRWQDGDHRTDVSVRTFTSEADPHLGVTQLQLVPDFDGTVRIRLGLKLWPAPAHRFDLAKLTLTQMEAAVRSSGQTLQPQPPATPDRAALWYPGQVLTRAGGGDSAQRTLWFAGQARDGRALAMAVAVALHGKGATPKVRVLRDPGRLALELRFSVQRGRRYTIDKYVAVARSGWGLPGTPVLQRALQARRRGFDALLHAQAVSWHALWKPHVSIDGDPALQRVVDADLFYLLENSSTDSGLGMAACGFSPNYNGHVFWDSDSWDFPALLLLHPRLAHSLVMFRDRTLPAALARARAHGYRGAMYPWEADPVDGSSQTPRFAWRNGVDEVHVDADIAIAQWEYYQATGDTAWLRREGWPVIRAVARFWASRATWDAAMHRWEIRHVVSPDEDYDNVDDDVFTNAVARKSLRIAIAAAERLGMPADPDWRRVADGLYLPFSQEQQRYLDFDPGTPHDRKTWMGSTLAWLNYPPLDLPMDATVRRNDFDYALEALKTHGDHPNDMLMVMLSVSADTLGDAGTAYQWLQRSTEGFLRPPFDVRTETRHNNVGYLLSASSGFVQNFIYGFTGLRIGKGGVVQAYPPVLPAQWHALVLHDISIRGRRYDIRVTHAGNGAARIHMKPLKQAAR